MRNWLRRARYRAIFLLALALFLFGLAEVRLLHLQAIGAKPSERSSIYREFTLFEQGERGALLDRRGGVLASSARVVDVRVWTSGFPVTAARDRRTELAQRLALLLGVDAAALREKLDSDPWLLVARGVRDPAVIASLRQLSRQPGYRALTLETRYERVYSRGALLAPLLGWVGWEEDRDAPDSDEPGKLAHGAIVGVAGLERRLEATLKPTPGHRRVLRDGRQLEMVELALEDVPPRAGTTVQLTLEPVAQEIVERALDDAMAKYRPEWEQALVVDPRTCDLLAIAQRPAPTSVVPTKEDVKLHKLLAAEEQYPPGSAFKPFMLSLVVERHAWPLDRKIDCEHGLARFGNRPPIHDTHPHGELTPAEILIESSNIGMAKLVLKLVPEEAKKGDPAFEPVLEHVRALGFGSRAVDLRGETKGFVPPLRRMTRNFSLASLSFGQEIAVTAFQMVCACSAVADGGTWRPLRIVRALEDPSGRRVELPIDAARVHSIYSPATGATLRAMLGRVVEEGGTRNCRPRGWSMGGKTGTAQDEKHHEIAIASYWCFAPREDPRFVVLVVLRHPSNGRFAADNAAPVAGRIMGELLHAFEVPPDRPEELGAGACALADARRPPDDEPPELDDTSPPIDDELEDAADATRVARREVVAFPAVGEGR